MKSSLYGSDRSGGRCHHDHGLQDSTEKNSNNIWAQGQGGGNIESGRNDLFTLRIMIENHFSDVFMISKDTLRILRPEAVI